MNKLFLTILLLSFNCMANAQIKAPYAIYNAKGKKVSYSKMMKQLQAKDIVLFGELHNNAIAHWLQLELCKELQQTRSLILGAEMIEADNQSVLNRYLANNINQKQFDTTARLWNNYPTDYKPLVDFAKENHLPFIATNIPRRYASMVFKQGLQKLDSLPAAEKQWIAPLPIVYDSTLSQYVNMMSMMGGHGGSSNMPKSQATKDATMAHFILQHYQAGSLFLHFNGSYHSEYYQGILWYLRRKQPLLKYGTITTVVQKDIDTLEAENVGKADFIICVDEDVTNTF